VDSLCLEIFTLHMYVSCKVHTMLVSNTTRLVRVLLCLIKQLKKSVYFKSCCSHSICVYLSFIFAIGLFSTYLFPLHYFYVFSHSSTSYDFDFRPFFRCSRYFWIEFIAFDVLTLLILCGCVLAMGKKTEIP